MPQTEYKGNKYIAALEELRNLGAGGILFRANYELSKKLGLIERKHSAERLSPPDVIKSLDLENPVLADVRSAYDSHDRAVAELIRHFKSRESPGFFFNWWDRELYQKLLKEQFADQEVQLVEQADKVCRHEFEMFDSITGRDACATEFSDCATKFSDGVNWHLEPSTGQSWPLIHWSKIDVRGPDRIGDVRLTWEINRHQFFFILGRAYWFTGDQKYAQEFASLMRGWLHANPPEMGVNWYSNLEIAVRLISWIWAYHFFLDSPFFDDDLHFDFLRTVLQSCRHITRDFQYSLRSMKNNHVIGDAAALAFAGIMFPEFKESRHWRKTYIDVLYRELDNQVYDDGTDFEQSISYHRFVLYFYLLLFRIMRLNNCDVPAGVAQKIEKMIEFMMHVMKPDRTMPQIGDCDDARTVVLSNDKSSCLTPTLSTGAVLFRREDFKWAAGEWSEEAFWINGKESIQIYDSLKESPPPDLSRGFPDGGYYIMRTGWDAYARYLLFKCGPHTDHAHADALHIELYCDGKSYLRDCGTYTYNGLWEWRTFFRSTKAHNTVVVDGESQSIPHRVFRWLKAAKPRTISWVTSKNFDYVDAEHDGYNRYKDPVTHRRAVFFVKPEYWVIVDRLIGSGKHSVELFFHTPCGEYKPDRDAKAFNIHKLAIIPVAPDELDMSVCEIQGWFSPCYGVKLPSTTLVYSFTGELPKVMATILDNGCSVLDARLSSNERCMTVNVKLDGFSDTFVFNGDMGTRCVVDTDAEVFYLREDETSGKITRLALIAGKYVRLRGKPLLEAKSLMRSIDLLVSPEGKMEIETEPKLNQSDFAIFEPTLE